MSPKSDRASARPDARCATESVERTFAPPLLEFLVDVSANTLTVAEPARAGSPARNNASGRSMRLEWAPASLVAGLEAFFEDESNAGVSAALTFFPTGSTVVDGCASDAYRTPAVTATALPSSAFRRAIATARPMPPEQWRGGTPTVSAMQGRLDALGDDQATPATSIVLLTTGFPVGCDGTVTDALAAVVTETENARARGVLTYVVGVVSPLFPFAPNTPSRLQEIADAGGTDPLVLDAIDWAQTIESLQEFLGKIPDAAGCSVSIPAAPGGNRLDEKAVRIEYRPEADSSTALVYDADCSRQDAWHYDDDIAPEQIVLCPDSCRVVRRSERPTLNIQLTWCELSELGE